MAKKEISQLNRDEMTKKLKALKSQKTILEQEIKELEQAKQEKFPFLQDRYSGNFYITGDRKILTIGSNGGSDTSINCWTQERAKEICKKMDFMFLLETLYDLFVITPKVEREEDLTMEGDSSKYIIRFHRFHTQNPFYYNAAMRDNDVRPYEVPFPDENTPERTVEYPHYLFSKHFITYENREFNVNFKQTYEVDFCKEDNE